MYLSRSHRGEFLPIDEDRLRRVHQDRSILHGEAVEGLLSLVLLLASERAKIVYQVTPHEGFTQFFTGQGTKVVCIHNKKPHNLYHIIAQTVRFGKCCFYTIALIMSLKFFHSDLFINNSVFDRMASGNFGP